MGGGNPRNTPRRGGAVPSPWCATRPQVCWGGVAPLARGPWAPLKSRFKGIGFLGKGGNRNPPFPKRPIGYFPGVGKVTRGVGMESPQGWRRTIFRLHTIKISNYRHPRSASSTASAPARCPTPILYPHWGMYRPRTSRARTIRVRPISRASRPEKGSGLPAP